MRSMSALQEHILIVIEQIMKVLTEKLVQVSKVGHCKKCTLHLLRGHRGHNCMVVGFTTS
jgi:hypothetical protein